MRAAGIWLQKPSVESRIVSPVSRRNSLPTAITGGTTPPRQLKILFLSGCTAAASAEMIPESTICCTREWSCVAAASLPPRST